MSTQTATTTVYINNEQAKKALTELESKLSSVNAARKKAFEEGDLTALTALDKEAKALGSEAEKLKKRFFDVNSVLQDLSGASVSDLNKALSTSRSELSKMRQTDPGYTEKKKQVSDLKDALEQANTSAGSHNKAMEGLKAGYMATTAAITGVIATIGGLTANVIGVYGEFEKYSAVLTNTFGSQQKANDSMSMLQDTATKLPVSLKEVTESYIKLVNRGMEPTQDQIIAMTDVASSQGKSLDQFVEAFLDAQTGEFERLKEFGVKAQKEGDKVTLTFKNQSTTLDQNSESIGKYLLGLGKIKGVAGSSTAVMSTMDGVISNLGDGWDQLIVSVGDRGLGKAIKGAIGEMGNLVNATTEMIKVPVSEKLEEERQNVNELALSLFDANLKAEDRRAIMEKLNTLAPEVIANLDAENFSYDQLRKNLEAYNQQMINRIVLQKKSEEVQKKQAEAADATLDVAEQEKKIRKELLEIVEAITRKSKYGTDISVQDAARAKAAITDQTKSWEERLKIVTEIAKMDDELYNGTTAGMYKSMAAVTKLKMAESSLMSMREKQKKLTKESSDLLREKEELAKELGITETKATDKTTDALNKEKNAHDKLSEAAKKAAKEKAAALKKLLEEQQKYLQEVLKSGMTATERENEEYEERLKKAGLFWTKKQSKTLQQLLNEKKITKDQYKALQILAQQHATNLQNISDEENEKRRAATEKLHNEILQDIDHCNKLALELIKENYVKELEAAGDNADKRKEIEEKYNQDILTAEMGMLNERKAVLIALGESTEEIEQQITDKKLEILNKGYSNEESAKKEHDAIMKEYGLESLEAEEDEDMKKIEDLYKRKVITTEEYEKLILAVKLKYVSKYVEKYKEMLTRLSNTVSDLKDAELEKVETDKEAELESLEDKYDQGLITEEEYNSQKTEIEEKYEDKANEVKKKYAGQEFALKIATITADTAVAAIEAYKSLAGIPIVGPALGIAAAAAVAVSGAAQVAIAREQYQQVQQLYTGGYTEEDDDDLTPVGIVHANEFVANAKAVKNPTVKPVLDIIDVAQRSGTIRNIDLTAAVNNKKSKGFSEGGYTSDPTTSGTGTTSQESPSGNPAVLSALVSAINQLNLKLNNLYAKVVMSEFKKAEAEYEKKMGDVIRN